MALAHCVGERWPAELARNLPFLVWGKLFRGRCLSGATRLHSCSGNSLGEVVAKGVHLCLALQEARTGEAKLQEQVTQKVADAVRGGHWRSSLSCKNQMQEEPTALEEPSTEKSPGTRGSQGPGAGETKPCWRSTPQGCRSLSTEHSRTRREGPSP